MCRGAPVRCGQKSVRPFTQQIKALEEGIGLPLFDRGGGRLLLTPGGKALLPFAEQARHLSEGTHRCRRGMSSTCERTRPRNLPDRCPTPVTELELKRWAGEPRSTGV